MKEFKEVKERSIKNYNSAMSRLVSVESNVDKFLASSDTMVDHYRKKLN
jgi:hypothetical protein